MNVAGAALPLWLLAVAFAGAAAQSTTTPLRIVSISDSSLAEAPSWLEQGIAMSQVRDGTPFTNTVVRVSIEDETGAEEQFCQALYENVALVVDITAGGWSYAKEKTLDLGIPYVHSQLSIYQWMAATDQLLQSRNSTDAALIFSNEALLDQGLYYLVEGSVVRVIVLSGIHRNTTETLKKMRPSPGHFVIFAPAGEIQQLFDKATRNGLVSRDSKWTLVMTSQNTSRFQNSMIPGTTVITFMTPQDSLCCVATGTPLPCSCTDVNIPLELAVSSVKVAGKALRASGLSNAQHQCDAPAPAAPPSTDAFYAALQKELVDWPGVSWNEKKMQILPDLDLDIHTMNSSSVNRVGEWSTKKGLALEPSFRNTPIKSFFRVGTIKARPWMYEKRKEPGQPTDPNPYEGYCVELTQKLAKDMNFNFEFVMAKEHKYGSKEENGSWNGLVGDLARGETDMIIAPLTMTSEREEVIDFVAPYFDQSGISIVIRKKAREESLFKFMTVLKPEVWVSIVAALVVTGIMIWFLDKYSPYSAQNNSQLQIQSYRKFTLKESFWFALTSFTPQGGGEAPKALSGRTLVASYWLFVVLMLATFTANLAAFLTVERMQTPVSSLEELAGQSKIKYSILRASSIDNYFTNMAGAEEQLYRVWKELTLNSTSDQSKYRVWDYPIKEQYTHILQVIQETGPMSSVEEALKKVEKSNGEFAFIHDASELKYEVYQNCELTEVGEPFAEQPYAIAVQQGSHLQDEISKAILELQKDRYFEALTAKYWNSSAKGDCRNNNDSEGINLQSLGGVFIATLIGLVLALIALAVEVMYYRRLPESADRDTPAKMKDAFGPRSSHHARIKVSPAFN